jgi:phosphocarrier protein HPr
MLEFKIQVKNRLGVHARPSGQIVQITSKAKSQVFLHYNGVTANAKSILNIMMLAIESGSEIRFEIEGEDETELAKQLKELFENKFYEEE